MAGAPIGNCNGLKHGRQAAALRRRLVLGGLPREFRGVETNMRHFRRQLEAACLDKHGEITWSHALALDAAVAHEGHAHIARTLLRKYGDKMSVSDKLACSRDIPKAKAERNKQIELLRLDESDHKEEVLRMLYGPQTPCITDDAPTSEDTCPPKDVPADAEVTEGSE